MAAGVDLSVIIRAVDQASSTFDKVGSSLGKLGGSAASVAPSFNVMAGAVAAGTVAANVFMGTVTALSGAVAGAAKSGMDFEQAMANIKATLPKADVAAFGGQLEALALKLGKDYPLSASEAAKAMEMLAQKGISAKNILEGGAEAVVQLASATGGDLVIAAGIAAVAMDTFNVSADDMGRVTDVMTAAVLRGGMSVNDFGYAMQAGGAAVKLAGGTIDDAALALAALAKAGIEGSDAGTSLKTMYMNLIPKSKEAAATMSQLGLYSMDATKGQSLLTAALQKAGGPIATAALKAFKAGSIDLEGLYKAAVKAGAVKDIGFTDWALQAGIASSAFFDASGKAKSFEDISLALARATKDLTNEQKLAAFTTIFGSDALRAAATAARLGAGEFGDLAEQMKEQGIAATAAAAKQNTLKGSVTALTGSVETLGIMLFQRLSPSFKAAVDKVNEFVGALIDLAPELDIEGAIEAVDNALQDIGETLDAAAESVIDFAQDILGKIPIAGRAMESTVTLSGLALNALAKLIKGDVKGAMAALGVFFGDAKDAIGGVIDYVRDLVSRWWPTIVSVGGQVIGTLSTQVQTWWPKVVEWTGKAADAALDLGSKAWTKLKEWAVWLYDNAWKPFTETWLPNLITALRKVAEKGVELGGQAWVRLKEAADWLYTNAWKPFTETWLPGIVTALGKVGDAAIDLGAKAWVKLKEWAVWLYTNAWKPFTETWLPTLMTALGKAGEAAVELGSQAWVRLREWAIWLFNNLWQPFINTWLPALVNALGIAGQWAIWLGATAWSKLKEWADWLYQTVWQPFVQNWLPTLIGWLQLAGEWAVWLGKTAWGYLVEVGGWLYTNLWKPFSEVWLPYLIKVLGIAGDWAQWLGEVAWAELKSWGTWLYDNLWKPFTEEWLPALIGMFEEAYARAYELGGDAWRILVYWGEQARAKFEEMKKWLGELNKELENRGFWDELATSFEKIWKAGEILVTTFWPKTQTGLESINKEGPGANTVMGTLAGIIQATAIPFKTVADAILAIAEGLKAIKEGLSQLPKPPDWLLDILKIIGNLPGLGGLPAIGGAIGTAPRNGGGADSPPMPRGGAVPSAYTGKYEIEAYQAALKAGIDPVMFTEQIRQESGFNPNARSALGALGIAQFMPGTAKSVGVNPLDPSASLIAAAKLMKSYMDKYGDPKVALAAYNAGEGNVATYGGVPPFEETQLYIKLITAAAAKVKESASQMGGSWDGVSDSIDGVNDTYGDLDQMLATVNDSIGGQYTALRVTGSADRELVRDTIPLVNILQQSGKISASTAAELKRMALTVLESGRAASGAAPDIQRAGDAVGNLGDESRGSDELFRGLGRTIRTTPLDPDVDTRPLQTFALAANSAEDSYTAIADTPLIPRVDQGPIFTLRNFAFDAGVNVRGIDDEGVTPITDPRNLVALAATAGATQGNLRSIDDETVFPRANGDELNVLKNTAIATNTNVDAIDASTVFPRVNTDELLTANNQAAVLDQTLDAVSDVPRQLIFSANVPSIVNVAALTAGGTTLNGIDNINADGSVTAEGDVQGDDITADDDIGARGQIAARGAIQTDEDIQAAGSVRTAQQILITPFPPFDNFESGGYVAGDEPIVVGEKGIEVWMPPQRGGRIIPNDALTAWGPSEGYGGVRVMHNEIHIHLEGTYLGDDRRITQDLAQRIKPELDRLVRAAV